MRRTHCDAVLPTPVAKAAPYRPPGQVREDKGEAVAVIAGLALLVVVRVVCAGALLPVFVRLTVMGRALARIGALGTIFGVKE